MKTNYLMLLELNAKYTPERRGIVNMEEIHLINEVLHLDEMDELQLRNLRDFTVIFYSQKKDDVSWDKMSAITAVIDNKLFNLGKEV